MESTPALFAGVVFTLWGSGLLFWTASRAGRGLPVTEGGGRGATMLTTVFGVLFVLTGVWCLTHV